MNYIYINISILLFWNNRFSNILDHIYFYFFQFILKSQTPLYTVDAIERKSTCSSYFLNLTPLLPSNIPPFFPVSFPSPSLAVRFRQLDPPRTRRKVIPLPALSMFAENPIVGDFCAAAVSGGVALSILRFWAETAKRGLFDQVDLLLT